MNTELGVVYPPNRMKSSVVESILKNLPWKIPHTDLDWQKWTAEQKNDVQRELGGNVSEEEVSEQMKPFFREFYEELMESVGMMN